MVRLRMTEKAARQLGRLPKTPEQLKAEQEAEAKARAEEEARRIEEKQRREAERESLRQRLKQEMAAATDSDERLREAVDAYNAAADATIKDREALKPLQAGLKDAENKLEEAARALAKAQERYEAARRDHGDALTLRDETRRRVEQANDVLTEKRHNVAEALGQANTAWLKLSRQRRKELRDRALKKNAARIAGVSDDE